MPARDAAMPKRTRRSTRPPSDSLWYKDAIIYEAHVRAFFDENHDGIGDFRGLTKKLDYLRELGVTGIITNYPDRLARILAEG